MPHKPVEPDPVEPSLSDEDLDSWAQEVGLKEANRKLIQRVTELRDRTATMVEAVTEAAYNAMMSLGPILPVVTPTFPARLRGLGRPEVALWHLTDWQGAKRTTTYNSEVMVTRVHRFVDTAEEITNIGRHEHPVDECVIMFGGDMVEGLFNFPQQVFEVDQTIFGQYVAVARLIVDVVRRALSMYEKVTVIAEWGNHGRIGNKRATVPLNDNFDRMCYELARQILLGEPRLFWDPLHGEEDIQRVEIGEYRALLIHGDEIGRTGFASRNTIVQHVNRWRSGSYPWPFRDVYVGHYHVHGEESMANGEGAVYNTGSTESDNRYAGVNLASSAIPSQRLHFIDPEKGRVTSQHKIWLENAVVDTMGSGGRSHLNPGS